MGASARERTQVHLPPLVRERARRKRQDAVQDHAPPYKGQVKLASGTLGGRLDRDRVGLGRVLGDDGLTRRHVVVQVA